MVKKGQFLLQIDPATYQADVQREQAAVASAEADLARAKANLDQSQSALRRSERDREEQSAAHLRGAARAAQDDGGCEHGAVSGGASTTSTRRTAALAELAAASAKTTILAPMNGRVTRLAVEEGETAVPGTFTKDTALLLTISDMSVLGDQGEGRRDRRRAPRTWATRRRSDRRLPRHDLPRPGHRDRAQLGQLRAAGRGELQSSDQAVDFEVEVQLLESAARHAAGLLGHGADRDRYAQERARASRSSRSRCASTRTNENKDSARRSCSARRRRRTSRRRTSEGVFVVGKDSKSPSGR